MPGPLGRLADLAELRTANTENAFSRFGRAVEAGTYASHQPRQVCRFDTFAGHGGTVTNAVRAASNSRCRGLCIASMRSP